MSACFTFQAERRLLRNGPVLQVCVTGLTGLLRSQKYKRKPRLGLNEKGSHQNKNKTYPEEQKEKC